MARGLVIPHLCHKPEPGYRPDGNCRACMVEVEGERTLVASCIRPPAEGMKVKTDSDRAEKSREHGGGTAGRRPAGEEAHDASLAFLGHGPTASASPTAASRPRTAARPAARRQPRGDARSISTPASTAICASAPAARFRSTTSSAWPAAAATPRSSSIMDDPMGDSTCVACGECVQACPTGALMPATVLDDQQQWRQQGLRPRGRKRLPLLRRRLPVVVQDQGQQDQVCRGRSTARRTRTGCASRAASASTISTIRTG